MDVRCERCGTEYELDPARLGPGTATVRCSACRHVFTVTRAAIEAARAAPPAPSPGQWLVRTLAGRTVSFRELTTLQKWIVEGRIGREDEISRNGETWKRLGNIQELEPFFSVYEKARTLNEIVESGTPDLPIPSAIGPSNGGGGHLTLAPAPRGTAPRSSLSEPALGKPVPGIPFSMGEKGSPPARPVGSLGESGDASGVAAGLVPSGLPLPGRTSPYVTGVPPVGRREGSPGLYTPSSEGAADTAHRRAALEPLPPAAFPGTLAPGPAAAFTGDLAFSEVMPSVPPAPAPRRRAAGLLITGGLVLLGVAAGGMLARLEGSPFARWAFDASRWLDQDARAERLLQEAEETADLDTEEARDRALALLEEAQAIRPTDGVITAERAYVLARSAMALERAARVLDDEADRIDESLEGWKAAVSEARRRRRPLPPRPEAPEPGRFRMQARERRQRAVELLGESERLLELAHDRAPRRLEPERARAAHLLASGALDEFAAQLERLRFAIAELGRPDPHTAFLEAAYRLQGFPEVTPEAVSEAKASLREALALRPSLTPARVLLARILHVSGRREEARSMLAPVLAIAPSHPEARALDIEIRNAPVPEGEEAPGSEPDAEVRAAGAEPARTFEEWLELGTRHREAGRVESALDAYDRAAKLKRRAPEPHAGRGWCLLDLRRPRLALLEFEKAASLRPKFAEAQFGVGEAQLRVGDRRAALAAYRRYLELAHAGAPDRPIALRKIATLEAELSSEPREGSPSTQEASAQTSTASEPDRATSPPG